eukprot:4284290-Pyramimonas_sp.AAC.1
MVHALTTGCPDRRLSKGMVKAAYVDAIEVETSYSSLPKDKWFHLHIETELSDALHVNTHSNSIARRVQGNMPHSLTQLVHSACICDPLPSHDWSMVSVNARSPRTFGPRCRHMPTFLTRLGHAAGVCPLPSPDWSTQR